MHLKYICTFWGCKKDSAGVFVDKVIAEGYDGIEIYLPPHTGTFTANFIKKLENILDKNSSFVFYSTAGTARIAEEHEWLYRSFR